MTSGPDSDYIEHEHSPSRSPHVRHESGRSPFHLTPHLRQQLYLFLCNYPEAPFPPLRGFQATTTVNRPTSALRLYHWQPL